MRDKTLQTIFCLPALNKHIKPLKTTGYVMQQQFKSYPANVEYMVSS